MLKLIFCPALVNGVPEECTDDWADWNCCNCGADVLVEPHAFLTFMLQHAVGTHLICTMCKAKMEGAWLN